MSDYYTLIQLSQLEESAAMTTTTTPAAKQFPLPARASQGRGNGHWASVSRAAELRYLAP